MTLASSDYSLHFRIDAFDSHSLSGKTRYQYDVTLMGPDGKFNEDKQVRLWLTAKTQTIALEIIEAYAQQVKHMDKDQYATFKEAHSCMKLRANLRHDGKKDGTVERATITIFKPNRACTGLDLAFVKSAKDPQFEEKIGLDKEQLEMIDRLAKLYDTKHSAKKGAPESQKQHRVHLERVTAPDDVGVVALQAQLGKDPVDAA